MKRYLIILAALVSLSSCEDFLSIEPQGQINTSNYYDSDENAETAVNALYDLLGQSEGSAPDNQWLSHHYEFFFGSMTSDDSEKGSKASDMTKLTQLIGWDFDASFTDVSDPFWIHGFWGVSRANGVIDGINASESLTPELQERYLGEAYFMRAYYYYYLARHFGGVPLFSTTPSTSDYGNVSRATLGETLDFIAADFRTAIDKLPLRSAYATTDIGRATKGAAESFLARVLMYQAGVDANADEAELWQEIYEVTNDVITSGEYSLVANFGTMFEAGSKNTSESIFEIQSYANGSEYQPASTGTGYCNFQANRVATGTNNTGWGFNNPCENLREAFDSTDPRLSCTIYGIGYNGGILYGEVQTYDRAEMSSNYLNRKAALQTTPSLAKSAEFNVILMRLADVYLMRAEAAYHIGNEGQAKIDVNTVRARARSSALCKGFNEGDADAYPYPIETVNLPDITSSGTTLLEAIWKERRLELAMESLRTWDLIRTGQFYDVIEQVKDLDRADNTADDETRYEGVRANALKHSLGTEHGVKVSVPVLTIPNTEVTAWGMEQNPM
ncbi:MAG: RagB/SusD family nutrient uptake outer membrane protein [Rikenellaceae bacterium]